MNKLSEAICFATEAFDGKYRKADHRPAIFHALEAAMIASTISDDEDVVCAAVLHDVLEDAGVTPAELNEKFGERITYLVKSETEEKNVSDNPVETWQQRKLDSLKELKECNDDGVRAMWLGDKLSNMRSFANLKDTLGDDMWDLFHQKDPLAHKAYYTAIANELTVFEKTDAYIEYISLIKKVFGE